MLGSTYERLSAYRTCLEYDRIVTYIEESPIYELAYIIVFLIGIDSPSNLE